MTPVENVTNETLLDPPQGVDWFLADLVQFCNETNGEFAIILQVQGTIVSGTMISGRKYFDLLADVMVEGWAEGEAKTSTHAYYKGFASIYDPENMKNEEEGPNYIHLSDARVHMPPSIVPGNRGVLWRGRLDQVGAFWMGQLTSRAR